MDVSTLISMGGLVEAPGGAPPMDPLWTLYGPPLEPVWTPYSRVSRDARRRSLLPLLSLPLLLTPYGPPMDPLWEG